MPALRRACRAGSQHQTYEQDPAGSHPQLRRGGPHDRITLICPPVVPAGGVVRIPGGEPLYGPQIMTRRSYSVSINNGTNEGYIHWEFRAIEGPATRLWVFDRANWAGALPPKHPAVRVSERDYAGHVISIWRFPDADGQLEGHDAAIASEPDISYFVSIHRHTHDDGDIAMWTYLGSTESRW